MASEYSKHGFRINVLVPGGIWTPGTKNMAKEAMKIKLNIIKSGIEYDMRTPMGRIGKPDEIARIALVLASDLSSYVNGTLVVDGGFLSARSLLLINMWIHKAAPHQPVLSSNIPRSHYYYF